MFDLAQESFAKQGDSFFLEGNRFVLIVSEALWEKRYKDIQKKKWFLFSKRQKALRALVAQLQPPASFSLTRDLPNEAVLLTNQTTVTLSNIEISVELFLVLLETTRVTVGENFFIGEHNDNEDCIRENGMMGETPVYLGRSWVLSSLALENIERMAPNSIGCVLEKFNLSDTGLINILPKLRIHGDCEIEVFCLSADEKEHVAEVLAQETPFCVGRVKEMWLTDYAVGFITKMSPEDCEIEYLRLFASKEAHVAGILKQENPFCVGRVKKMWLRDYAVGVITKMNLKDYGVEDLRLYAREEAHVAGILKQENPFCVGRVKSMDLEDYAVCVITKMSLKDCEIEWLVLDASEEAAHVAEVLAQESPFCVGRVKKMKLTGYAASVITKMTIHEDNTMERFVLAGNEDQLSRILKEGDNSIDLGRIRTGGLQVPERIKRKLRYTLVDGEGKEVLEEEEPSQRGNLLE
ncbi:MAG: uncharacterized protein A8A55_0834 [Amphiamblys sp. WSBS2006]|nr:MAG: uncharacterized protein A8A55_0834 [Amphiamblys sp. WSBS2006]